MDDDKIDLAITPACGVCGEKSVPLPDDPEPRAAIACPNCGSVLGTRQDFAAKVKKATVKEIQHSCDVAGEEAAG